MTKSKVIGTTACLMLAICARSASSALVLHYDMNEVSGNLINSVNATPMGAIQGGVTRVPGPFADGGYALSFNGVDGTVVTPEYPVLTAMQSAGAMECWYYRPTGAPRGPYMAFDTQTGAYEAMRAALTQRPVDSDPDPANNQIMGITSATAAGPVDFNYGSPGPGFSQFDHWNHIAMTWGDGTVQLYLNGAMVASGAGQPGEFDSGSDGAAQFYLGQLVGFSTRYYTGLMDEVSLWNNQLTASEVLNHYNAGLAAMVPEPSAWLLGVLGVGAIGVRRFRKPV
jgi:hypothetical protein